MKKSKEFTEYVKNLKVDPDEELRSYDVSALFTSIPVNKAMVIIRRRLEEDENLNKRTALSPNDIITLLEKCFELHILSTQGPVLPPSPWSSKGLTCLPRVCNLYMAAFKQMALAKTENLTEKLNYNLDVLPSVVISNGLLYNKIWRRKYGILL